MNKAKGKNLKNIKLSYTVVKDRKCNGSEDIGKKGKKGIQVNRPGPIGLI